MPESTAPNAQRAYELRVRDGLSFAVIATLVGFPNARAARRAVIAHAATNSLPDPVARRSERSAARFATRQGRTWTAEDFDAANDDAVDVELGGAVLSGRTFGCEIEFHNPRGIARHDQAFRLRIEAALNAAGLATRVEGYGHTTRGYWKLTTDATTDHELVSPILSGRDGLRAVRTAMTVLRSLGCRVTSGDGGHIHIYAGDLTPVQISQVHRFYGERQATFSQLVARGRRGGNSYCATLAERDMRICDEYARRGSVQSPGGKFMTVNLTAYSRQETIEFRQHQGTLNGRKNNDWVELLLAVMTAVERDLHGACPTDLGGMLGYFVSESLLKQATAERLARKATGYGFATTVATGPVVASPTPEPAHVLDADTTADAPQYLAFTGCDCAGCVAARNAVRNSPTATLVNV